MSRTPLLHSEQYSTMEVARRVAFAMAGGVDAKREIDKMDAPTTDAEPEPTAVCRWRADPVTAK